MKLEIGMYVRTKAGMIAKIVSKEDVSGSLHREEIMFILDNGNRLALHSKKVIKASFNIIDLIEVGDVITFKEDEDVYKVSHIPSKKCGLKDFYLVKNYDGETEDIFVEYDVMKKDINSIVTKEQFESVQYKVGE